MIFVASIGAFAFSCIVAPLLLNERGAWNVIRMAPFASALSGALCWWFVIEASEKFTRIRYIVVGLLCGVFAHPLMWLMIFITEWFSSGSSEIITGSEILSDAMTMSLLSLGFTGWATAAVGATGGWLFWKVTNRSIAIAYKEQTK